PVKRYSSGMQVKLAFAVATSIEAEILIVDEVLAVGDLAFQRKCFDRMERLIRREGRTVIIVGHNIRQLEQICTRMIMLTRGRLEFDGASSYVATKFLQQSNDKIDEQQSGQCNAEKSKDFQLIDIALYDALDRKQTKHTYGQPFKVKVYFSLARPINNLVCFLSIHSTDFVQITANETYIHPKDFPAGEHYFEMRCQSMSILPGVYSLKLWVGSVDGQVIYNTNNLSRFQVISEDYAIARLQDLGLIQLDASWASGQLVEVMDQK
ncbi:MAG: Wzt carbohydrate-binding domain-containing protein, partial [Peptococcaceae bacterium]|nr:Wzt carbohydrate-binding domain-containing protein [Peptococcaceae bacterium]